MGARRKAREYALMMLYGMDQAGQWPDAAVARFFESFGKGEALDPPPSYLPPGELESYQVEPEDAEARGYAERLARGVIHHREELDQVLQKISQNWRLERMALVDRNLLRLGAYELLHESAEVPRKVAINEAVELAKLFGTEGSSAFVNGILDRIGK
ncbi:MAG: transcription antitermination factor NusB [Deltaproteobacteria bacterium]|jgi:N utilization substance protein B|nr:transcription antitermination factor NusB [Deltaproteobacteria bacterium]